MIADSFDKYATMGAYHWRECDRRSPSFNPPLLARYEAILSRIPPGRVIDVGAGDGYLSGRLSDRCAEVVALEHEPAGVVLAHTMLAGRPNVIVIEGSAYAIPFDSASFDGLIMADVIEHLDDPAAALAESARVLRDDGVALLTTPQFRKDRKWDHRHVREYTPIEFREMLAAYFETVECHFSWPRFWFDIYETRVGWRVMRLLGRGLGFNPFLKESSSPERSYQMIAICHGPKRGTTSSRPEPLQV